MPAQVRILLSTLLFLLFFFSLKFTICNLYYYHGFAFPNFYSLKFTICNLHYCHGFAFPNFYSLIFTICNLYYYHGFAFPNFYSLKFTICNLHYYHGFAFRKGYFVHFCERWKPMVLFDNENWWYLIGILSEIYIYLQFTNMSYKY